MSNLSTKLSTKNFDFIDFGCSKGGSINFAQKTFKAGDGLGIDIDPVKVKLTRSLGLDAEVGDLTKLGKLGKQVHFSIMSHFLEHVPSIGLAAKCILSAVQVSKEFIYIQQPYFDADGFLFHQGLKLFWSDWHGHPNRMTSLEFHNILHPLLKKGAISRFAIYGYIPIENSQDDAIHPLSSPVNSQKWDFTNHDPKPDIQFLAPVFREIRVLVSLQNDVDFVKIEQSFKWHKKIHDSITPPIHSK